MALVPTASHAAEESFTIVALGDSTTAGTPFFHSPLEAPPDGQGTPQAFYGYWITLAYPDWRVLNRGVNGQRTDQIRARFSRDVLSVKPKYVIILGGVNDIYQGRPLEETQADLLAMYQEALAHHITPIAATVLPFTEATPEQCAEIRELNRWIKKTASLRHIPCCDTHRAVAAPEHADRLKGSPDGLHPDLAGYQAMGEALKQTLVGLEATHP